MTNKSAAKAVPTGNEYEAHYRPVWAASFRIVKNRGQIAKFSTELAARSAADAAFPGLQPTVKAKGSNKRTIVEKARRKGKEISVERIQA